MDNHKLLSPKTPTQVKASKQEASSSENIDDDICDNTLLQTPKGESDIVSGLD